MPKELLFSVTAADCEWQFVRSSGKGGQNVNKRSTAVRCIHRPSGAVGFSQEQREQRRNRETAFERMASSKEFENWVAMEVSRISGKERYIEQEVERQLKQIKVEIRVDGKWVEVDKDDLLLDTLNIER